MVYLIEFKCVAFFCRIIKFTHRVSSYPGTRLSPMSAWFKVCFVRTSLAEWRDDTSGTPVEKKWDEYILGCKNANLCHSTQLLLAEVEGSVMEYDAID